MKLFTYRGIRVQKYHEKIRRLTFGIALLPFLLGAGYFVYTHQVEVQNNPTPYAIGLGGSVFAISLLLLLIQTICYKKFLFLIGWIACELCHISC